MTNWKKKIVLFLASQTVSLFGSSLVLYAITWHITMTTQSGIMMTVSILCGFIPTFFISPVAGVWADRYSRKALIIMADALIAIATLVLAVIFLAGYRAIWLLFVIQAIRAAGTGIQTPAINALIPQMVPEGKLTRVNATNGSIQSVIMLVSPMLSALFLTVSKIELIFFIDVITAVIAIFILLTLLHVPVHARALEKHSTGYFSDMRMGFSYIGSHGFLKRYFLFCGFLYFMITPVAFLTTLQITRSFGNEVWRLSAMEITFSAGMIAGGIIIASWGGFKNRIHTMSLSSLVMGACTLALGAVPVFWIYLVFMGLIGVAMPALNTPATVLLQEKVEGDYLGRVFGVLGMLSGSMMPMGMLIFGPVADIVRIEYLLLGSGVMILLMGFFMLRDKVLIESGMPATEGGVHESGKTS